MEEKIRLKRENFDKFKIDYSKFNIDYYKINLKSKHSYEILEVIKTIIGLSKILTIRMKIDESN